MWEIDKLRKMLDEAGIPYESIREPMENEYQLLRRCDPLEAGRYQAYVEREYGEAAKWARNQIIYGRTGAHAWKFDAIWQKGSYGAKLGLLETYGKLGTDKEQPRVMNADTAFKIISDDWKSLTEKTRDKYRKYAQ